MSAIDSPEALGAFSAAITDGVDATSVLQMLLTDCVQTSDAATAGILVSAEKDHLDLLPAHSHRATELELHQANLAAGPCYDVVDTGQHILEAGDEGLMRRWPQFASLMLDLGLHAVIAVPMRWRSQVLGGLNIFWGDPTAALRDGRVQTAQIFADFCAIAVMQDHSPEPAAKLVADHLRAALDGRVVIERAKGVLSFRDNLDMDEAYDRLIELSREAAQPLMTTALRLLEDVASPRGE